MRFPRSSGILLHPTSLASRHGIGDLGREAYEFLDFLESAGQTIWQVLPLGPTGYGDSPYQCFSAFAGNPLLISLDRLVDQGLLSASDLRNVSLAAGNIDFPAVQLLKLGLLRKAASAFAGHATPAQQSALAAFRERHRLWLDDFALFMALKERHGMIAWPFWQTKLRDREPVEMERVRLDCSEAVFAHTFFQFVFFEQWDALHADARRRGIRIMGDIPIYAAGDSSDVWARRALWQLREDGQPAQMAGVPPDYFSATGQLWGNPIYRWDLHALENYAWWVARFRGTFEMVDMVRVDHFRGFQAYWQVPFGEPTAMNGSWIPGPGADLFEAVERVLGPLPIVAENLGVITPAVEEIRRRFRFPGMAILQFAFGRDPQAPDFKPHNYPREIVAYSGTHDNDTTAGWWTSSGAGDSTRSAKDIAEERAFALSYLGADGSEIHWSFIRALMASVADTVIFPAQDLLGLGSSARMNMPSTLGRNWKFRLAPNALSPQIAERLHEFARNYDRLPPAARTS